MSVFPQGYRGSGLLPHVTSLPSRYGIGDVGPAALAWAPLQDLLNLDGKARMNTPGQAGGNWRWRLTDDILSPTAFDWLRALRQKPSGPRLIWLALDPPHSKK